MSTLCTHVGRGRAQIAAAPLELEAVLEAQRVHLVEAVGAPLREILLRLEVLRAQRSS